MDECGVPVRERPGRDQRVRDMGPAHRAVGGREGQDLLPRDREVRGQVVHHAPRAGAPVLDRPGERPVQGGVGGIHQVAEQVDGDAVGGARDLDPAQQRDARLPDGGRRLVPTGEGVVVGQADHGQAGVAGGPHQLGGGVGPVRVGRVGVRIDAGHPPRIAHRAVRLAGA